MPECSLQVLLTANQQLQSTFQPPFTGVQNRIQQWERLTQDNILLEAIRHGVRLPLTRIPARQPARTAVVAVPKLHALASRGILRLLSQEEIQRTNTWTPTFGIPKPHSSDIRLINDMRNVNSCFPVPHYKQDTVQTVIDTLASNSTLHWGANLDLRDWFYHLQLHPSSQRWVRLTGESTTEAYQFLALPMGLKSSPFWLHRLQRPLLQHFRNQAMSIVWYVDDLLILGSSPFQVQQHIRYIISMFNQLGLQLNVDKCQMEPVQDITYLGLRWNHPQGMVPALPERVTAARRMAAKLASGHRVQPVQMAKLAGILQHLQHGALHLRGLGRPLMHLACHLRHQHGNWHHLPMKDIFCRGLLHQFRRQLRQPVAPVHLRPAIHHRLVLRTDASQDAWAAVLHSPTGIHQTHHLFEFKDREAHITLKETLAVLYGLMAFRDLIPPHSLIEVRSDCTTTVQVLNKGSPKFHLNVINIKVIQLCLQLQAHLQCHYTPGASSEHAMVDRLSRLKPERNDYAVDHHILPHVCQHLQTTVNLDMFADAHNRRCRQFWSWRPSPLAQATDAFNQSWAVIPGRHLWCNPRWPLVGAVLKKAVHDQARLLICVPLWRGQWWWALLQQLATKIMVMDVPTFVNPHGSLMPRPKWKTCFALLDGRAICHRPRRASW